MSGRKVVTPRFEIVRRDKVIKVVPLHRSSLVIGSEGGADLRLKHPAIASRHLEVFVVDGRYLEARNLAGEGRVLLGGQPMDRARLREGDELDLGPVSLRLTYARAGDELEDEATDADAPSPAGAAPAEDEEPPPDVLGDDGAATGPTGSRLGRRRRAPPGPRGPTASGSAASGMDLDLDDVVLDPTPLVTIEPPGGKPQKVPLRVGSFVVGAGRCAFRLSYPGIAPAHAEMMVMPDGLVYLKHLAGAGQVTLRNGAPIQFSRWLSGDRIQVGPVSMQLVMVSQDALAEAMAQPVEASPRRAPGALPRLDPVPGPPPSRSERLVAAPRSSTPPPSTVPDPLSPEPWTPPPPEPKPELAPPVIVPTAELPPPPSAELPTPSQPPAPPPSRLPLIRVRRSGESKPAKRELRQAHSPLVTANPVEIRLDVRAADTYRAHARGETGPAPAEDDDLFIDYKPAWWRRAGAPVLIVILMGVIGAQFMAYRGSGSDAPRSRGPRVAAGAAGVERDALEADNAGGGRVVVGDPRRRTSGGGEGSSDDWQPDVAGRHASADGLVAQTDTSQDTLSRLAVARADAAIREDTSSDDSAKPSSSGGGKQGWVEMKEVEAVMYANRKSLAYCYTVAREADPSLSGILWLSLTLAEDGRIRGAVAEPRSSVQNSQMLKCLQRQLYRLEMPTPRGGSVTFSYPFELAR